MSYDARAHGRARNPRAMRRAVVTASQSGATARAIATHMQVPLRQVRRILQVHAERAALNPPAPAPPTFADWTAPERDQSSQDLQAVNELVLADLRRAYGDPQASPSLVNVQEKLRERLIFTPDDVTASVCGDPPPGRSALAVRGG